MLRVLILATLFAVMPPPAGMQAPSVLHIRIVLAVDGQPTPVARHALLISDNPSSAPPRRVVVGLNGLADVPLRPGSYTVESDRPVAFQGKAYQWTQAVDMVAGRDATLELTAANAEIEALTDATSASAAPMEADPSPLLGRWQESVVAVWSPTAHASGFLVDASGLIVTTPRAIGTAPSVEVQLSPAVKVRGTVLVSNAGRDVAVLRIDPAAAAALRPVPLGCAPPADTAVTNGLEVYTIGVPLRGDRTMTRGQVSRVGARLLESDLLLPAGSAGGPVFTAAGAVLGLTAFFGEDEDFRRGDFRVVRIGEVCDLVASATAKMAGIPAPDGVHLPVEPARPSSAGEAEAAAGRTASHAPYQMSSSDFEIAFITPSMLESANDSSSRGRDRGGRGPDGEPRIRPLDDFSNWAAYVEDTPPVLMIRVTPKFVEGFWTKVARGAASTQGVSIPPIKRFRSGFSRLRAFCGATEVTPIHPFKLEQRVSESDAIYEGLYVFDPGAFGPACATVKLVLYSEKAPENGDTRQVDAKLLERINQDLERLRPQQ